MKKFTGLEILCCLMLMAFALISCTTDTAQVTPANTTDDVLDTGEIADEIPTQAPAATSTDFMEPALSSEPDDQPEEPTSEDANRAPCSGVLTSPNQEGPFYSAGSPLKSSLIEDGMAGTPVLVSGFVYDQDCRPIQGAKLDFWLADVNGEYDNVGYTLRGHTFSGKNGDYTIESIEPTSYTGRPPHIHVKVFAPEGHEILTTQMYFSGSEESGDVIASPDLLAVYRGEDNTGRILVEFNFVVQY